MLVLLAGTLISLPRWQHTINVGAEQPVPVNGEGPGYYNYFGFHDAEQAQQTQQRHFRWTSAESATITFPYVLRQGPLTLELALCGCGSQRESQAQVVISSSYIATLPLDTTWRVYRIAVPPRPHPDYGVMVELRAPLWATADGRLVGVAVDGIALQQAGRAPFAGPLSVVAALLCVVLLRRVPWSAAVVVACWALGNALYRPQLVPREALVCILVLGAALLLRVASTNLLTSIANGAIACWLAFAPQLLGYWVIDDAFISFRYAQHLVQGDGLVFNAGERVEGYTNFLWTALVSAALRLSLDPIVVTLVLTLALAFVVLALTYRLGLLLAPPLWCWAALPLLAFSKPFLLYTAQGSGMETALFTALLLAAMLAFAQGRWAVAGALTALAMLTRPDGVVLAGVYSAFVAWGVYRRRLPRRSLWYIGTAGALFAPYFVGRWLYYGYPLPNTFYVKVGGSASQIARGALYLWEFCRKYLLAISGAGGALVALWALHGDMDADERGQTRTAVGNPASIHARSRPLVDLLPVAAFTGAFLAYVVAVGGDWMYGYRFFVPVLPPLALLSVAGAAALFAGHAPVLRHAYVALVAVVLIAAARIPDQSDSGGVALAPNDTVRFTRRYRAAGLLINGLTAPDASVAVEAAGALPYYAERPTIDMLGLNDAYIAHMPAQPSVAGVAGHEKIAPAYVLGRRPAIIPYYAARPYLTERPEFAANYRLEEFFGPEGGGIKLFVRNDVVLRPLPATNCANCANDAP
ncbi:MAG: hypothetical protein H7Y32_10550 [Chloroflexales bacterium]|nr:hypothetical protein [Chloroflexales bacterium]